MKKFADLIGVQRSSVSHVLSGRNNPSYDFLQKTLKAFPGLKADWIMLGTGPMYEQMGRSGTGDLFDAAIPDNVDEAFELSQYAVQTRYPGEWEPVTKTEAKHSLERAALVLRWVEAQI